MKEMRLGFKKYSYGYYSVGLTIVLFLIGVIFTQLAHSSSVLLKNIELLECDSQIRFPIRDGEKAICYVLSKPEILDQLIEKESEIVHGEWALKGKKRGHAWRVTIQRIKVIPSYYCVFEFTEEGDQALEGEQPFGCEYLK